MKSIREFNKCYLHRGSVDFRKGINGLSLIVDQQLKLDLLEKGSLFLFCNKKRDKVKILYWDRTGFAVWHKQLEEDRYKWPKKTEELSMKITSDQLNWLLEGVDLSKIKTHSEKSYKKVV